MNTFNEDNTKTLEDLIGFDNEVCADHIHIKRCDDKIGLSPWIPKCHF